MFEALLLAMSAAGLASAEGAAEAPRRLVVIADDSLSRRGLWATGDRSDRKVAMMALHESLVFKFGANVVRFYRAGAEWDANHAPADPCLSLTPRPERVPPLALRPFSSETTTGESNRRWSLLLPADELSAECYRAQFRVPTLDRGASDMDRMVQAIVRQERAAAPGGPLAVIVLSDFIDEGQEDTSSTGGPGGSGSQPHDTRGALGRILDLAGFDASTFGAAQVPWVGRAIVKELRVGPPDELGSPTIAALGDCSGLYPVPETVGGLTVGETAIAVLTTGARDAAPFHASIVESISASLGEIWDAERDQAPPWWRQAKGPVPAVTALSSLPLGLSWSRVEVPLALEHGGVVGWTFGLAPTSGDGDPLEADIPELDIRRCSVLVQLRMLGLPAPTGALEGRLLAGSGCPDEEGLARLLGAGEWPTPLAARPIASDQGPSWKGAGDPVRSWTCGADAPPATNLTHRLLRLPSLVATVNHVAAERLTPTRPRIHIIPQLGSFTASAARYGVPAMIVFGASWMGAIFRRSVLATATARWTAYADGLLPTPDGSIHRAYRLGWLATYVVGIVGAAGAVQAVRGYLWSERWPLLLGAAAAGPVVWSAALGVLVRQGNPLANAANMWRNARWMAGGVVAAWYIGVAAVSVIWGRLLAVAG